MRRRLTAVLLAALAACSTGAGAGTVRVVLRSGSQRLVVRAEVAADPTSRARGLMGRHGVPAGTGMYFVFPGAVRASFYMKNTLVPLDIAWVRLGRVVEIAHMQPCAAEPCPLWTPRVDYDAALETAVGGLQGMAQGATVEVFGRLPQAF